MLQGPPRTTSRALASLSSEISQYSGLTPNLFPEQVGGVQSFVGLEQLGEGPAAVEGEILAVGEQRIALSLDEGAVLGGEAAVLAAD